MTEIPPNTRAALTALKMLPDDAPIRGVIVEQLLTNLISEAPMAAEIISDIFRSIDNSQYQEWGEKASAIIRSRILQQNASEIGDETALDVLVLTVKKKELIATLAAFDISDEHPNIRVGEDTDIWKKTIGQIRIGVAVIGNDGNSEAAIELQRIAADIRFPAAILVGMAAGLESECSKGDVIIASTVHAYDFVRATTNRYFSRAKPYTPDARSVSKVAQLEPSSRAWAQKVKAEVAAHPLFKGIEEGETERFDEWMPSFKTGGILAGSRLIEDGSLPKLRESVHDRAVAAEMEGAGFAAACTALRLRWLVIRGIADYGKDDVSLAVAADDYDDAVDDLSVRGKSWQFPATYAAAAFVRDMVVTGRLPLLPNARTKTSQT